VDTTQATLAKAPVSRAILVTLAALGCGNIGFASGIVARTLGDLTSYEALATGAAAFVTTLFVSLGILVFVKGEGASA